MMTKGRKRQIGIERPISWEELEDGVKHSLNNAERLNSDAERLLKARRYASSRYLALVAKEEIGKALLLADYWSVKRDVTPSDYLAVFRSGGAHRRKLAAAGRFFLKYGAWQVMSDFFAEQDQESKERSLYVDYSQGPKYGYWVTPSRDLDFDNRILKAIGRSLKEIRKPGERIDEIDIASNVEKTCSVIKGLRAFLEERKKVMSGTEPSKLPAMVAPLRSPPKIRVSNEFSLEDLMKQHEIITKILRDQGAQPPASAERFRKDIARVPSYKGKLASALFNIGSLRSVLLLQIEERARILAHYENKYNDAVELMNEVAMKVLIPFNRKESQVRRSNRRRIWAGPIRLEPLPYYPRLWKRRYRLWKKTNCKLRPREQQRAYGGLEHTFAMLGAQSFSSDNFPRLEELTQDELNRFMATGHFT